MAVIHDTIMLEPGAAPPSLSSLIGSSISIDVFDNINSNGFETVFGSDFRNLRQDFFEKHIKPHQQMDFELSSTVNMIMNPDNYRILDKMEDYFNIPPCMEMAILTFEPVRQGVLQGRMEGFGYDPETIPTDDMYGRLIQNFTCEDVAEASDDDGYYDISATMYSDDLELNSDALYSIRKTRDFIEREILAKSDRDPTAISLPRG